MTRKPQPTTQPAAAPAAAPFPWNPQGFVRPSVAHLFQPAPKRWDQAQRSPSSYRTPGPACQFTIFKTDPAKTGRIKKAQI